MKSLDTPSSVQDAESAMASGVGTPHFKEALARLAGGLAIVTCWHEGAPHGLLVSSITGLSVEPPRFLFCVRREASAYDVLVDAHLCGVSILSANDEPEALTFVDPTLRALRFTSSHWRATAARPPVLNSSLSTATCLVDRVIDAGTHSILIVTAQSVSVRSGEPLLSYNRGLRRLQPGSVQGGI